MEWGHGIDYNTDSDGNHDADHDNAYGIVGKICGRDSPLFSGLLCYFLPVDTIVTFLHFAVKNDIG